MGFIAKLTRTKSYYNHRVLEECPDSALLLINPKFNEESVKQDAGKQ